MKFLNLSRAASVCLSAFVLSFVSISCVSRAPTENELDRRAGLLPSLEVERAKKNGVDLHKITGVTKNPIKPVRASPWFERVWVYDQELDGGYWMQGTYVFLEVEPGRWVRPEEVAK